MGVRTAYIPGKQSRHSDIESVARSYQFAVTESMVEGLAKRLGVTVASLYRLGVGWAHDLTNRRGPKAAIFDAGDVMRSCSNRCMSFPMTDGGKIIGIRIRTDDGRKFSIAGGCEGLFVPTELQQSDELLFVEGPTDTAALLDLGFATIGRPSAKGGYKQIVDLVKIRRTSAAVVVADNDDIGKAGAESLASLLRLYTSAVKIIFPPTSIKDSRAWKLAGGTFADVRSAIDAATAVKMVFRREVCNAW